MLEEYEEFISFTLRTWSSKKPLGMHERIWEHQWLPLCFARHARRAGMVRPVVRLMISNQNLRVSWSSESTRLCEQNTLTRHIFSHLHALILMSHT